jgi:hypothetical protein
MDPRRFLWIGGSVLISLGLLGVRGVLGSISRASFFHPPPWINWVHLSIGGVALSVAARGDRKLQTGLTFIPAVLGTTLGVSGLLFGSVAAKRWNLPELADPSDHLAHLMVGILASWGWLSRRTETR